MKLLEEDKINFGMISALIYSISYVHERDEHNIRNNYKDTLHLLCSQLIFPPALNLNQIFEIREE
jgi:hypothetical protein